MSLSQDEINALLTGGDSPDESESEAVEIMSPEEIEAMLNTPDGSGFSAQELDSDDLDDVDILSPEMIAAMLDDTAALDDLDEVDSIGSTQVASSMDSSISALDDLNDLDDLDDLSDGIAYDGSDDLDDLFDRLDEDALPPPLDLATIDAENAHLNSVDGLLDPVEIDILGEVGNISMGAVATTMYSLLDRRVSITTPRVSVFDARDVLSVYRIPFVVATIEYIEGISGNNLLVLKVEDAALITDLLMGGTGELEGDVELNEMHLSAMSEIMNQMMGASSTSLSKLLGKPINISPPKSSQVDVGFDVTTVLGDVTMVTKISFDMEIEGLLKSELIQLIPYEASREFAKQFMDAGMGDQSELGSSATAAQQPQTPTPAPAPVPAPAPAAQQQDIIAAPPAAMPAVAQETMPAPAAAMTQPYQTDPNQPGQYPQMPPAQMPYDQAPYQQVPYQQAPAYPQQQPYYAPQQQPYYPPQQQPSGGRLVDVHPVQFQSFDSAGTIVDQSGIDLVYNIPLQVTVELGKTRKEISEILEFGQGTIVVLDKIAGDPVEIVVNGKLIARGEVVVIDESYGVRITDIIHGNNQ